MDFQCDRCGQKYHVADEKLQGRTASRFKCKKCENNILLTVPPPASDGSSLRPSAVEMRSPSVRPSPGGLGGLTRSPSSPPRARMPTSSGPAFAGGPGARTAPAVAARVDASDPDENDWFAGIRGTPTGPLSRTELALRVATGDVTGDTLVWRDGFGDWRPLKSVPALKDLTPSLRVVQPAAMPSFVDFDSDATVVSDQGPAMVAAAMRQAKGGKHEQALQDAPTRKLSALTHEQLRDIRLPPANERSEPHERPAPRPSVAPSRPSASPSAQPSARPPMAPVAKPVVKPSAPPLAPPSKVRAPTLSPPTSPVGQSHPAPMAAPVAQSRAVTPGGTPTALARPSFQAATSAPLPSLDELMASAAPSVSAPAVEAPQAAPTPEVALTDSTASSGWDDPLFKPSIPPSALSTPAPAIAPAHGEHWADPLFQSHPPPAAEAPSVVAVSLTAPAQTNASLPPGVMNTGQVAFAVDVARPKPRGVPKSVWVLTAGLAVAGVAAGIAIARRPSGEASTGTHVAAPLEAAQPELRPVAASANVAQPAAPVAESVVPSSPDMVFSPDDNSPAAREHRRRVATHAAPAAPEPTGQQRQAQLERMLGLGAGSAPPPPNTNSLPALRTPTANASGSSAQNNNSNNPSPQPTGRIIDTVRTREAERVVERSGVVRQCWEQFKLRNPAAPRRSLNIGINVAATGQVTLRVADRSDPTLSNCIENRSSSVRSLGPGSAISSVTRADLD